MKKIDRILGICFSPTGGTRHIVEQAVYTLAEQHHLPFCIQEYTTPTHRSQWRNIREGDLVVWGSPVYAGRIPNKTLDFVKQNLHGENNPLVAIAVYGGRHWDNALIEMSQLTRRGEMNLVGACAMVSRHVFSDTLGKGRPNDEDLAYMRYYLRNMDIAHSIHLEDEDKELDYYQPMREDRKPAKFLKATPQVELSSCSGCGTCVESCTMGSIRMTDGGPAIEGICIKCMACVFRCPNNAFKFTDEDFLSHIRMIEQSCSRNAPLWFAKQ